MIDRITILVKGGDGGGGSVSFRHEKYAPFGGPDGGDGGDGGDVVVEGNPSVADLRLFRKKVSYQAGNGGDGRGKKQYGHDGEDRVLMVPVGTVVVAKSDSGEVLTADCDKAGARVVVARGGRGGLGNTHFASSTNQTPRLAQKGEAGEERTLELELRLIADVGIIGYPNAGKSTLLSAVSAARPKIASYPFTTLEPVLGTVEVGWRRVVMAEIPGLIEDAHLGRGLGHEFLRHITRTRILIHLIDGGSVSPLDDMARVNVELGLYDAALAKKPQLVAVNKVDLMSVRDRLSELKAEFNRAGTRVFFISAETGEGVAELMAETVEELGKLEAGRETGQPVSLRVFHPRPQGEDVEVRKDGDTYVVLVPWLERVAARVDISDPEVAQQLRRLLASKKVSRALLRAGVRTGDKVRCGSFQWEWLEWAG